MMSVISCFEESSQPMNDYVHEVSDEEVARIQRFGYSAAIGTAIFIVLIILAIVTAQYWVKLISHEGERQFISPHVKWVNEHLLDESDPALQAYVDRLGREIAAGMELPAELQLEFFVIDGSTANAFTTLGGYIFVLDGLVRELDDENSLAMVLAHEIAHAANRDPLSSASRGILLQIMISSATGSGGFDSAKASELGSDIMLSAYSREQEEAADQLAVAALQRQYGHVGGATRLFEALQAYYGDDEVPEILSSHPDIDDRIAAITMYASEQGWSSETTTPYPSDVQSALNSTP
jgi:predicted Zn-dependent protease